MAQNIISKGNYSHPGIPNFVSVKQYMVIKKGGKKQLFLRFENPKAETLTAITFTVNRYNASGDLIGKTEIVSDKLSAGLNASFSVNKAVVMENDCADFKVDITSAHYGDYKYVPHGEEIQVIYDKVADNEKVDSAPFLNKMGGKNHKNVDKTLNKPSFFFILTCFIIVAFSIVCGIGLYNFTQTEYCFTLDKVEYTFASEDRVSGPINVIGYKGVASNIVIPAEIEGHAVEAVGSNSFKNATLRSITFEGSVDIAPNAFASCHTLQTVSFGGVKTLGENAFANCMSLQSVTIGSDLRAISRNAFFGCTSLKEITLPETVETVGDYAFYNCQSLLSLTLPDAVHTIGVSTLYNCSSLESLTLPFVGRSIEESYRLNYLFDSDPYFALKDVTVTQMTKVADHMFEAYQYIENISFTADVTTIGNYAFSNCSALAEFNIPQTVVSIGNYAFLNCNSLISASIPDSVLTIARGAFRNCYSLTDVTIGNSVNVIEDYAFYGCGSIKELIIPQTVEYMGADCLSGCLGITNLTIPFLKSSEGMNCTLSFLLGDNSGSSQLENFTLLSGTALADFALAGFMNLKSVTLPEEIETLGDSAFANCCALSEFTIPETITSVGESAFLNCSSLKSVTIPTAVEKIENNTFSGCSSLESITLHDGISSVGDYAFAYCSSVTTMVMPSAIEIINEGTFYGCTSLLSIYYPETVAVIDSYAFYDCSSITSVYLHSGIMTLGDYALSGCASISSIEIPKSITNVGSGAFSRCTSLTVAIVPLSIVSAGSSMFAGCESLESLTAPFPTKFYSNSTFAFYFSDSHYSNEDIPQALKRIRVTEVYNDVLPSYAFAECSGVSSISIPDSVESIGSYAFYNCSSLTSLSIPNSVEYMGSGMLCGATGLEQITLPYAGFDAYVVSTTSENEYYYADYVKSQNFRSFFYDGYYSYTIPTGLKRVVITKGTSIPDNAFEGFSSLEEIVLPSTLESIGPHAFENCNSLGRIELPASLRTIRYEAFKDCYRLYELVNYSQVSSFSSTMLEKYVIRTYTEGDSLTEGKIICDGYTFLLGNDNYWYLIDYDRAATDAVLPESPSTEDISLSEYKIPQYLFYQNENVANITIPSSVTSIGTCAFAYCDNLASVDFSNASSLTDINDYAFYKCVSLIKARLPESLQYLGRSAFYYCENLASVTVHPNLYTIGEDAFYGCYLLYEVYNLGYNDIVKGSNEYGSIAANALIVHTDADAEELHDVDAQGFIFKKSDNHWFLMKLSDNNVNTDLSFQTFIYEGSYVSSYEIYKEAFMGNGNITSVYIGSVVSSIGYNAFNSCYSLKNVTFAPGCNVDVIEPYTFYNCSSITGVTINDGIEIISNNAFSYNVSLTNLTLPSSLLEICYNAFEGCQSLGVLTIPDSCSVIGSSAFSYCNALTSVTLPSSIKTIESYTFYCCYSLPFIAIPDGCSSISYSAFANCSSLAGVSFPGSLSTIESEAFISCSMLETLEIPEGCTYVGSNAFAYCSSLKSISLPSTLSSIESGTFSNCSSLTSVAFPEGCTSIGYNAFTSCNSLRSVYLPKSIREIYGDAFYDCYRLYDVIDCTNLNINAYSSSYGCVGYYAVAVHSPDESIEFTTVESQGLSFEFAKYRDKWYLIYVPSGYENYILELPELKTGMSSAEYTIFRNAFMSLYSGNHAFVVPNTVAGIDSHALNFLSMGSVYFKGSSDKFNEIKGDNYFSGSVYYYSSCIHSYGYWNYDASGNVTTDYTLLDVEITEQPSCTAIGEEKSTCPVCKCEWFAELSMLPHNYKSGVCTVCKHEIDIVTSDNIDEYDCIINDSEHAFTVDENGLFVSTNKDHNTDSTLKIIATNDMTVIFKYSTSSEDGYDKLIICKNGKKLLEESGDSDIRSMEVELKAGDELTFTYHKDGSTSFGNDCAYIQELEIVPAVEEQPVEPEE